MMPRTLWLRVGFMWGVGGAFLIGLWSGGQLERTRQPWGREQLLSTALDSVRVNFLDSLPEAELLRRAVSGMLRELNDPYAALLERDGITSYRGTLRGESQALGLLLRMRGGSAVVRRVLPGSPAAAAGLSAGDLVLAVDGRKASDAWLTPRPTGGVPDSSGQVSDSVRLEVVRLAEGDTSLVTVVRARWRPPAVTEALLAAEGVGYARLSSAASGSAEELERAVEGLLDRGARSLVLDLRGNMGGLFEEGVKVASLFLERGQVVASLEHRGAAGLQSQIAKGSRWPALPLAVLVDKNTASSAELIAAALRDHGRALLVGEHTYGKGLVQRVVALNGQMSLRMTTARWLPPSGEPIARREEKNGGVTGGLAPDVHITPAGRLDVAAVPATLSPALARTLSDAVDGVVMRAMQDGWSGAPLPLLERRTRGLLEASLAAAVPDAMRRAALVGDGIRVTVRRLLEMTRGDEALWSYASLDDAAFRAALDVVAPGLSTAAPVADAAVRAPARDSARSDSVVLERLRLWTERRFAGRLLDVPAPDSGATPRPAARIDGRLRAATPDTLVALHFAGSPFQPAYSDGGSVRLADPSGALTPIDARVVARLPFRAPVVPAALTWRGAEWRHGWAYLLVLPAASAEAHSGGFAGWRLAPAPAKAARVAARAR